MNHHSIFPPRPAPAPKPFYTERETRELGAILNTLPDAGNRPVTQAVVRTALAERPQATRLTVTMDAMRNHLNHLKQLGMVERIETGAKADRIVMWVKTYSNVDLDTIRGTGQLPTHLH